MPQRHCQGDQTVLSPRTRQVSLFYAGALAAQEHYRVVIVIVIVVIDVIVVIVFVAISLYVAEKHHGRRSPTYGNKSTKRRGE